MNLLNKMQSILIDLCDLSTTYDSPKESYQIREILSTIEKFNEGFKTPFTMFLSGYQHKEIADILNLPIRTVKCRIFFAKQKLQCELKKSK
jgi:RNA polymerase sigma-70 factor (ECF subfamily)